MADIVLINPRFEISYLGPQGVEPAELLKLPARQNRGSDSGLAQFSQARRRTGPLVVCRQGLSANKTMLVSLLR